MKKEDTLIWYALFYIFFTLLSAASACSAASRPARWGGRSSSCLVFVFVDLKCIFKYGSFFYTKTEQSEPRHPTSLEVQYSKCLDLWLLIILLSMQKNFRRLPESFTKTDAVDCIAWILRKKALQVLSLDHGAGYVWLIVDYGIFFQIFRFFRHSSDNPWIWVFAFCDFVRVVHLLNIVGAEKEKFSSKTKIEKSQILLIVSWFHRMPMVAFQCLRFTDWLHRFGHLFPIR